jgi:DNA-binding response OmpR family regulator
MKTRKSNIVLIEDDLALGSLIMELLLLNDFNVNWFVDGMKAIDHLKTNMPDIIISDMMMPIMNGEQLYMNIRKNIEFSTVPFVIITANMDDEVKYRQLENGVNDYIMKPFQTKELIFKIRNLLQFKKNIEKKIKPDPFSKVSIRLSGIDFLSSVNDILLKDMKSKIGVDELAKELFISRSSLDKRIRKLSNKNISQYIREFKLQYAIKLIDLGEKNVQFLVDETGFNSFSYFSTSFKSYVGLTTRDYIKSIKRR